MVYGYLRSVKSRLFPPLTKQEREDIYQQIQENSTPSPSFYLMVCLSTLIAAYGLLANSTAVVIGAMLVAPLMGPIFGIALGLSSGDNLLSRNAVVSEILGVLVAICLAALIGMVPLRPTFGTEILARTQPTIYDIIIALASGLAGAYAMVNKRLSPALPGVAVATALVPPLATTGLCLATRNWDWALGAFLLFLANLLAIEIAAAIVYSLAGLIKLNRENGWITLMRRFSLSLTVLLLVAVFMTHTLYSIVSERQLTEKLRTVVSEEVKATAGARLSEIRYDLSGDRLEVMAVVLTPQEFRAQRVADMEKVLQQKVDPRVHLVIRSLISRDADRKGQVFIAESEKIQQARLLQENQMLSKISKVLNEELGIIPGTRVTDIENLPQEGYRSITAVVHTPSPISPGQVDAVEKRLNEALEEDIRLVVRSIITRDADKQRYIYDDTVWQEPLSGPELKFHRDLQFAIVYKLYELEPSASLLEFYYGEKGDSLLVLVQIRSPYVFAPEQVRKLEAELREVVDERIVLIVRSTVGADAASEYYVTGYEDNFLEILGSQSRP